MCEKVSDIKVTSPSHLYAVTIIFGTWLACTGVYAAFAVDYNGFREKVEYILHKNPEKNLDNTL